MLEPAELPSAFLGEVYRYRLALHDQDERVGAAMDALRARRDQIEQATRDLLFSASMPPGEFERRLRALYSEDIPEIWRLKSEAQFLLTALHGIYRMGVAVRESRVGDVKEAVGSAIAAFEEMIPNPLLLRNIHEHFEAYARGEGHQRQLLPDPASLGVAAMTSEGLVYFVGGRLFSLPDMIAAGEELASAIAEATRESED